MEVFTAKPLIEIISNPKNREKSVQVFGEYIHKNELAVIFGDTNSCKSLLSGDISLSVACNHESWGGKIMSELPFGTPVFYYDLEMSDKQVAGRYLNMNLPVESFIRICFTPSTYGRAGLNDLYEDIINRTDGIEDAILVVIDNMQCFVNNVQNATAAGGFMDALNNLLSVRNNLTIIVVGHCIKRNMSKPLTQNDLAGSKLIANKADVIIGISESARNPETRYVKVLKNRARKKPVEVAELEVSEDPYLHLVYTGLGYEDDHLRKSRNGRPGISDEKRAQIIELSQQGVTIRAIAEEVSLSKSSVQRVLTGQS